MTTFFIIVTSIAGLRTGIFAWGTWYANRQCLLQPNEGWNLSCLACMSIALFFGTITALGAAAVMFATM